MRAAAFSLKTLGTAPVSTRKLRLSNSTLNYNPETLSQFERDLARNAGTSS